MTGATFGAVVSASSAAPLLMSWRSTKRPARSLSRSPPSVARSEKKKPEPTTPLSASRSPTSRALEPGGIVTTTAPLPSPLNGVKIEKTKNADSDDEQRDQAAEHGDARRRAAAPARRDAERMARHARRARAAAPAR